VTRHTLLPGAIHPISDIRQRGECFRCLGDVSPHPTQQKIDSGDGWREEDGNSTDPTGDFAAVSLEQDGENQEHGAAGHRSGNQLPAFGSGELRVSKPGQ
jgi:hypothetical protein